MENLMKNIKDMLESGEIAGFLGLIEEEGHPIPFLFTKDSLDKLDALTVPDIRYPMTDILLKIVRKYPEDTIGVMVRGCDDRALIELAKNQKILSDLIRPIGVACTKEMAEYCRCSQPYPREIHYGEKVEGVKDRSDLEKVESMDLSDRLDYWMGQFSKCIKCYGCRNICSMCFCDQCTLEDDTLILTGQAPPEIPIFHLIRAFHMAGRCIDCGLCEEACPAHIPLRSLYRKVREDMADYLGYVTGMDETERDPLEFLGSDGYEVPTKIDET